MSDCCRINNLLFNIPNKLSKSCKSNHYFVSFCVLLTCWWLFFFIYFFFIILTFHPNSKWGCWLFCVPFCMIPVFTWNYVVHLQFPFYLDIQIVIYWFILYYFVIVLYDPFFNSPLNAVSIFSTLLYDTFLKNLCVTIDVSVVWGHFCWAQTEEQKENKQGPTAGLGFIRFFFFNFTKYHAAENCKIAPINENLFLDCMPVFLLPLFPLFFLPAL